MKTFQEEFIVEESKTDLDLGFPYYEGDNSNKVIIPDLYLNGLEIPSMDLDEAILILEAMKAKGANRVYFSPHIDHQGYYFYGTKLEQVK